MRTQTKYFPLENEKGVLPSGCLPSSRDRLADSKINRESAVSSVTLLRLLRHGDVAMADTTAASQLMQTEFVDLCAVSVR